MRKIKLPKIGEYVLASRWPDKDPLDPWCIGFVESIIESLSGIEYMLVGNRRKWKNIYRISKHEGEEWLRLYGSD